MASTRVPGVLATTSTSNTASPGTVTYAGAVASGDLLVCAVRLGTAVRSIDHITDTAGNTWARAVRKQGASPPNVYVEIWWAASGSAATPTVSIYTTGDTTLTGPLVVDAFRPPSPSTWAVQDTDAAEETTAVTSHTCAAGIDAAANDVMLAASRAATADGGTPTGFGTGWLLGEETGTAGQTLYRLPSSTVTGDTVPWTSVDATTAASATVVFRPTATGVVVGGDGLLLLGAG